MHMVGHNQDEMRVPNSLRVSIFDRFENAVGDPAIRQLILPALFAVNRSEVVGTPRGGVRGQRSALSLPILELLEERFPARPGVVACFFVSFAGGRTFAFAHEAVAGAVVNYRLVFFAGRFH